MFELDCLKQDYILFFNNFKKIHSLVGYAKCIYKMLLFPLIIGILISACSASKTINSATTVTPVFPQVKVPADPPCNIYSNINLNNNGNKLIACEDKLAIDYQNQINNLENQMLAWHLDGVQAIIEKWNKLEVTIDNATVLPWRPSATDVFYYTGLRLSFLKSELSFWQRFDPNVICKQAC